MTQECITFHQTLQIFLKTIVETLFLMTKEEIKKKVKNQH